LLPLISRLLDHGAQIVLCCQYTPCLQSRVEIGQSPGCSVEAAITRWCVQQRENSVIQLLAGLQMATRNMVRPRTSVLEANGTLGTKPRNPLEDRLRADSKIPSH